MSRASWTNLQTGKFMWPIPHVQAGREKTLFTQFLRRPVWRISTTKILAENVTRDQQWPVLTKLAMKPIYKG